SLVSSLCHRHRLTFHSFPTRRSSDLSWVRLSDPRGSVVLCPSVGRRTAEAKQVFDVSVACRERIGLQSHRHSIEQEFGYAYGNRDRKSTRLNSSHVSISYAVFCLKKK